MDDIQKKQLAPQLQDALCPSQTRWTHKQTLLRTMTRAGWGWEPDLHAWVKGCHKIGDEALDILIQECPMAVSSVRAMLEKGAIGWATCYDWPDAEFVYRITPKWPDVIEHLGGIKCDE